jgi:simple sugar transport system permease protein
MTPLLFAATGGVFPALAGTLNIAIEGLLLIGAFSGFTVFYFTENLLLALLAAAIVSTAFSSLHAFCALKLHANIFITGLAVNLLSGGLCAVLSEKIFNTRGVITFQSLPLRFFIYAGLILLAVSWLVIYKTPYGYRLRCCEKQSEALVSLGINPVFYQFSALLISGFFAGLGGVYLSLNLGAFVNGMSSGKGWIVIVIIYLGVKKPFGILVAAFLFAFAESLSNYLQGLLQIPVDFLFALPYIATLAVIVVIGSREKSKRRIRKKMTAEKGL